MDGNEQVPQGRNNLEPGTSVPGRIRRMRRVPEGRHIALADIAPQPLEQQIVDKPGSAHPRSDRHQATGSDMRYLLERLRVDNPAILYLDCGFLLENALSLIHQLA